MMFEVNSGSFSYPGREKPLLSDIAYQVKSGEILGILGRNGAGKTTLLRLSMGILPWKSGASYLDGTQIQKINHQRLWQRLSYVPQARTNTGGFTVSDMVLLGRSAYLKPWQQPGERDREVARRAMEQTDILPFKDQFLSRLSGGELQMVMLARALAGEPELIILDEPESNLDFKNQLIILDTIRRLSRENHLACIFNTHYPAHALQYADKALLLDGDGSSRFGSTQEVITRENLERIFDVRVHIHQVVVDGRAFYEVLPLGFLSSSPKSDSRKVWL